MAQPARPPQRRSTWPPQREPRAHAQGHAGPRTRRGLQLHMIGIRALSELGGEPSSTAPASRVPGIYDDPVSGPSSPTLLRRFSRNDHAIAQIPPALLQNPLLLELLGALAAQMGLQQGSDSPLTFNIPTWSYIDESPPPSPSTAAPLAVGRAQNQRSLSLDSYLRDESSSIGDERSDTAIDDESSTAVVTPTMRTSPIPLPPELKPTTPTKVGERRYANTSTIALQMKDRDIPAMFANTGDDRTALALSAEGWEEILHPEGSTYYVCDELRIVTSARVTDRSVHLRILEAHEKFERCCGRRLSAHEEVVLELDPENPPGCVYYICNHSNQTVYWVNEINAYDAYWLGIKQTASESHLRAYIKLLYSDHMQLYPHRPIPRKIEAWVISEAAYYLGDAATNDASTSPYKLEELEVVLKFEKRTRHLGLSEGAWRRTHMIARFWNSFLTQKFLNFHYQDRVRLERTSRIQESEESNEPGRLTRWLTFLVLFNMPLGYKRDIDAVWVDQTCYGEHWEKFIANLISKWNHVTTLTVILLTANVGFLAIPTVDNSGVKGDALHYLSVVSTLFSFASMLLGMILSDNHRKSVNSNGGSGQVYFQRNRRYGMGVLATIYSLPNVFFLWSALIFGVAFFIFGIAGSKALNVVFGVFCMLISIVVIAVVAFFWGSPADEPHTFQTFWYQFGEFEGLPHRLRRWFTARNLLPLFHSRS
ncbi:hypothetical protein AURDEDRAFT_111833 [Auricularia subglabra TFB-10046 SS5]|nr:hypothetical protein AURDEDRAFT_111833 [Auricularia subglabra TFB-10046 SS5]